MKTINDLPPEILYRILELSIEPNPEPTRRFGFRNSPERLRLREASLVSRAWRTPSQSLLVSTAELGAHHLNEPQHLNAPYLGRTIQQLNIVGSVSGWTELDLRPRRLRLAQNMENPSASILTPTLLHEVHHLGLFANITGDFNLPSDLQLPLKTLEFSLRCDSDTSFVASLIAASPDLRHLVLEFTSRDRFPHLAFQPLLDLIPRLHHLTARGADFSPLAPALLPQLLATASALKTLTLDPVSTRSLHLILSALTSPLEVLTICITHLDSAYMPGPGEHLKAAQLLPLLDLPGLKELKRWRLSGEEARIPFDSFEDMKEWRDACEARGIEVRDDRRYFPD